jgi:hypothetical protein
MTELVNESSPGRPDAPSHAAPPHDDEWLLPFRQSRLFGPLCAALGLALGGLAIVMIVTTPGGIFERVAPSVFPTLLGVVFWNGGRLLAERRGGVQLDADALRLFGGDARTAITFPRPSLVGAQLIERAEGDADNPSTTACVELITRSGVRIALAEAPFSETLEPLGERIRQAFDFPRERPAPARPSGGGTTTEVIHVGAQGRMPTTLAVTGGAMLVAGGFAMFDSAHAATGTFVGTPLLVCGLLLLLVPGAKAALNEHIELRDDGTYTHDYRAFGLSWGARTGRADAAGAVRLRQRGVTGATIELVGHRRVQLIAGGVQGGPVFGPDALVALAERIEAWRARATGAAPGEPAPETGPASTDEADDGDAAER